MCVYTVYYVYINTHTCMYIFKKMYVYILNIFIYDINDMNVNIYIYKYFQNICCISVYLYIHNKYTQHTHTYIM